MSTLATQPESFPDWKQEVNRRLAEHKSRKDASAPEPATPARSPLAGNPRAAQAAAKVAARYANAPSFSEMQAAEARAALRAAETATLAALEAQAVAQRALAHFEAGAEVERFAAQQSVEAPQQAQYEAQYESPIHEVRFESDADPYRSRESAETNGLRYSAHESSAAPEPRWTWDDYSRAPEPASAERHVETVEPAQPIHANLIEFPREIIATRRVRPRNAGEAVDSDGQLSIFEVDPSAVSTSPDLPSAVRERSIWSGPEGIELDARPAFERAHAHEEAVQPLNLDMAPWNLRLMASMVDMALVVGIVCLFAAGVARFVQPAIAIRTAEVLAALLVAAAIAGYQWLFLVKGNATPGMRYAGISLCTFDDERPTPQQLKHRFYATLVSVLPAGLGMAWAIFDEDRLSWHDRLSRTYQRRC